MIWWDYIVAEVYSANYLSYALLLIAGAFNGIMDLVQHHFKYSVFNYESIYNRQFWDPSVSWKNKWKDGHQMYGEKFWKSSTWFVFTTDGWHLMKFFMIKAILLAVVFHDGFNFLDIPFLLSWYAGFWSTFETRLFRI
jgi:hypothetical protein